MFGHRLRRWPNNNPELGPIVHRLVLAMFVCCDILYQDFIISDQTNSGLTLSHHLRRWPNINPELLQRLVLAVFFLWYIVSRWFYLFQIRPNLA